MRANAASTGLCILIVVVVVVVVVFSSGLLSPLADADSLRPSLLQGSSFFRMMLTRAPGPLLAGVLGGLGVSGDEKLDCSELFSKSSGSQGGRGGREELRQLGQVERFADGPGGMRWSSKFML